MTEQLGLSNVYEHYIDSRGYKYFVTSNPFIGTFIRQVQGDGWVIDASDGNIFQEKMKELGFDITPKGIVFLFSNYHLMKYRVWFSNNGIPNSPEIIDHKYL